MDDGGFQSYDLAGEVRLKALKKIVSALQQLSFKKSDLVDPSHLPCTDFVSFYSCMAAFKNEVAYQASIDLNYLELNVLEIFNGQK